MRAVLAVRQKWSPDMHPWHTISSASVATRAVCFTTSLPLPCDSPRPCLYLVACSLVDLTASIDHSSNTSEEAEQARLVLVDSSVSSPLQPFLAQEMYQTSLPIPINTIILMCLFDS